MLKLATSAAVAPCTRILQDPYITKYYVRLSLGTHMLKLAWTRLLRVSSPRAFPMRSAIELLAHKLQELHCGLPRPCIASPTTTRCKAVKATVRSKVQVAVCILSRRPALRTSSAFSHLSKVHVVEQGER